MQKRKPTTIDEYIDASPEELIPRLIELHECIRAAAPGAVEALKWSMPAYSYQKILVTFAVFKNHIGFFPMPSAINHFAKVLTKFKTAKGSIQFQHNEKLPLSLITRIVKYRVKESKAGRINWKS